MNDFQSVPARAYVAPVYHKEISEMTTIITPDGIERVFSTDLVVNKNGLLFFNSPVAPAVIDEYTPARFNLPTERWIKEAFSAFLALLVGQKYAHIERGLSLKIDPTKRLPMNAGNVGYISHEYEGKFFETPKVPGWHEIFVTMGSFVVAEQPMPYEKGHKGEKGFITRARYASQKASCMSMLISGTSLVCQGPFYKNDADGNPVWDTEGKMRFVNYVTEVMEQPTREELIALSNEHFFGAIANRQLNAVTAQAFAAESTPETPAFVVVSGQPVAVADLIGKAVVVFKANGFMVRQVHVTTEADLQKLGAWTAQGYVLNNA